MVSKGTWVRIHRILLQPVERSANLPEDTRKVPFELWTKGFLEDDAELGDEVFVKTVTGRREHGTLDLVEPSPSHGFGAFVPELLEIDRIVRDLLKADGS
jgi:hypothetical protein